MSSELRAIFVIILLIGSVFVSPIVSTKPVFPLFVCDENILKLKVHIQPNTMIHLVRNIPKS